MKEQAYRFMKESLQAIAKSGNRRDKSLARRTLALVKEIESEKRKSL